MSGSKLLTDHFQFYSFPVLNLWNKTGCEVPLAKSLTAKSTVKHFEACVCLIRPPRGTVGDRFWCLPLFSSIQRQQTDYRFPEEGNSFHSSKQAKQTLPKVWSPQGSEGHCTRCSFHIKDVTVTANKWKHTFDLEVNGHSRWKAGKIEWIHQISGPFSHTYDTVYTHVKLNSLSKTLFFLVISLSRLQE